MKTKQTARKKVIKFRPSLFWDADPKTIDPQKHARYIIERILDFGMNNEVKWMAHYFPRRLIKNVTQHSRVLDPKSRALWSLIYQ